MRSQNENRILSPFTAAYWRSARDQLSSVRSLALAGLVIAMAILLESMPLYILPPSLKIFFSFLPVSVGCCVYGPLVGMLAGGAIDSLGFLLAGYGEPYFPGYLLSAVLSGFVYGLFLYRRRLTVLRIVLLRVVINFGSNVLLGSVWKAMLYGKGYYYYLTSGFLKNIVCLPIEVLLTVLVLRMLMRSGLVPGPEKKDIPWF